jgi:hypothetical protein
MSERRLWIAVLAVLIFAGASAFAQDEKNEVGITFGRTNISTQPIQGAVFFDPNIRYGRGFSFDASYTRRLFVAPVYSLNVEVPVLYNTDEKLHAGGPGLVPGSYTALFAAPSARVNFFPTTAVSPWGSIGGGFEHINESSTLLYGGPNTGKNTNSGVLQYGVGLDVRVAHRWYLRGEARDFWGGEPDFPQAPTGKSRQHNYFLGGGIYWRF